MRKAISILFLSAMLFSNVVAQTISSEQDSTFWSLSLPEIQGYKAYYMQELERLYDEKRILIQRGIEDGERLLQSNPDYKVKDEILIRLADLYYYQAKEAYFAKMDQYDELLDQYQAGKITKVPDEPRNDFSKALAVYQQIIDEFPQSELIDDAIYNKAFLYEEMSESDKANKIYLHLIDAYPNSVYVPEAYTRLAESYFNPPVNDLEEAIRYFKKVLNYKQSPRYVEALYKLGWSYYRLSEYPQAVSYFTTLIEDFQISEKYAASDLEKRSDLRQEAIDYIAISFVDYGGPQNAKAYLSRIGYPDWSTAVLEKLGYVYMKEKEEYLLAIETFNILLQFDVNSEKAPAIQQNIVDCYRLLEDKTDLFQARQRLFQNYSVGSRWWETVSDEKAKLQGYELSEAALRENINEMIQKAKSTNSKPSYEQAVELGHTYLKTFPEDPYAYMIRWNIALILDVQLHRYKDALQEYLTISLVYNTNDYSEFAREKGLSTVKDAAENAIVVADSLVKIEHRQTRKEQPANPEADLQTLPFGKRDKTPLTPAESWLSMAYDNFIKLFPFDERTPSILTNAGALFYTHNQFPEALKYFKTLVKYFPKSPEVHNAHFAILESYFGRKDYESAEMIAKTIIEANVPPDLKKKAERRMGEAIFLKAQMLSDMGHSAQAADEFYRMALEASTLDFADRALFNAAREYEKLKQFPSAIRAYELLRSSYSGSKLIPDVLNNLALNYGEIQKYKNSGQCYEALHTYLKTGDKAENALYNAWVSYANGQIWSDAIRVGKEFVSLYPNANDAVNVYYRGAEFALAMNDTASAIDIYQQFPQKYPDSALGVNAYYRQGTLYQKQNQVARAISSYQNAYDKNQSLKLQNLGGMDFIASEALYFNAKLLQEKYDQIMFKDLGASQMSNARLQKETLLKELAEKYRLIAGFGTYRMPEAVYLIGHLYEHYARHWADQTIATNDPVQKAVKQKEINEKATTIYGQAYASYKQSISLMGKVLQASSASTESSQDSIRFHIMKWQGMAKEKVSETLYHMAELNDQSINRILDVPIPSELTDLARLEYQSQVLLKAIQPLIMVVVAAHQRNLMVADSLGVKNQWTEASSQKIKQTLGLMGSRYSELAFEAMDKYDWHVKRYNDKVLKNKQSVNESDVSVMVDLIDVSKSYGEASVQFFGDGIVKCEKSGLAISESGQIQNQMVASALQLVDAMDAGLKHAIFSQGQAQALYDQTQDILFEDALAVFEDHDYFLSEAIKSLLERAVQTESQLSIASQNSGWLKIRLVQFDPATYSDALGIPIQILVVPTDTTWMYTSSELPEWEDLSSDTITWRIPGKFISENGMESNDQGSVKIIGENVASFRKPLPIYFRKSFVVAGLPVEGGFSWNEDSPLQVIVNQYEIKRSGVDSSFDLSDGLRQGENLLALAVDPEKPICQGLIRIQYIPNSVLPKTELTRNE